MLSSLGNCKRKFQWEEEPQKIRKYFVRNVQIIDSASAWRSEFMGDIIVAQNFY
jgi:hypothetical protein